MHDAKETGRFMFGGYQPPESEENPWPPKRSAGLALPKRIDAAIRGGQLVWLRDYDEVHTLAVAVEIDGVRHAYRIWPCYRRLVLNDDGSVSSETEKAAYTRHWIWADQTSMVYMLMENSEKYAEPLPT